ncbi:DnaJ domain-containing protein [Marinobacter sp.]|uniref:DnaJ domain-containing protein n=1 Tax=Marinobacter sp. TaxID=50741 RepID=UPI0035C766CC
MQWILGIALAAAVFVILKQWGALTAEKKKAAIWKIVLVVGGALLVFMVLTGRVHVLTAAVAAVIPLLRKLPALLKYAPAISRLFGVGDSEGARGEDPFGRRQDSGVPATDRMSVREACDILGVDEDCPEQDIVMAHRRLMQKLHPDRGGNDYLAAKLNEAKQVLLARRKT